MPAQNVGLYALNRGEVSKLALARVDIERLRLSAESQINWLPTVVGPAMLRPGMTFVGETKSSKPAQLVPFVAGQFDTALLELTDLVMRVRVNDDLIQRVAVSTTIPSVSSGSWTPTTNGQGAVTVVGSALQFNGAETGSKARATASATVSGGDAGKEHALRIVIGRGPIQFRVGSADNLDDYIANTVLDNGTHSLAFTPPAGTFYATFETTVRAVRLVNSVTIEGAGVMEIPAPWAESGLSDIRFEQSADVLFACASRKPQYRIERRSVRSWSIARFRCDDGPFGLPGDDTLKFSPSSLRGDGQIQSSRPYFKPSHIGGLIRLFHSSQTVYGDLAGEDYYSPAIRVSGVAKDSAGVNVPDREFAITISGTWSGTITLQRSFEDEESGFVNWKTYTGNGAITIRDDLTNSIVWYRLGFNPGDYTSGVALVIIGYGGGGGAGVARITELIDDSNVYCEVLSRFYATTQSSSWHLGEWSDFAGFPTSLALHEGRMWFAGASKIWGSVSDAYTSNDYNKDGDAGPINRTIGQGPIANINWILALTRLMLGADTSVITARSNSFDEPLTPSVINLKPSATLGAALLPAVKVDTRGVFVHASGRRAYEIFFDVQANDYTPLDLTRLHPDILRAGVVSIAVQRQPDTRVHFVLADGTVACLIYDKEDQVEAWWRIQTDGIVERAAVLPGSLEDKVYYVVKRTINGSDKRYVERFARMDECQGAAISKLADCHLVYDGAPTASLTGLTHLAGRQVVVWADGKDLGTYTVTVGGVVTLAQAVSKAVVGLGYKAKFVSSKLAYAAAGGTALNRIKRVDHLGFVLGATHYQGIRFGASEDGQLDDLPQTRDEAIVAADTVYSDFDEIAIEFPGEHDTDSRVYFEADAPRPATIKAVTISLTTNG